jgi:transcriptional regulator
LTQKPLAAAFLDNDMGRFEEYMDRRRDLIVEVITQLMVPDAR